MNVRKIVKKYLEENGYYGLCGDSCGCGLDDLMPCDGDCQSCEPAYKHVCPGVGKCPNADTCESGGGVDLFCYGPKKNI